MRAVLVHGDSRGADRIAASIWQSWGGKVETHRADWDQHGKKAGPLRNQQIVAAGADICPGAPSGYPTVNSRFIERSCRSCHVKIHGSNHPSGAYFVR